MKVFSMKFLFNVAITKRALNLRRVALFIYILGAIVFQIDALFTPDAFSVPKAILALPFSQDVNSSNEDKRIVPVKFYENADTGCYILLPPISPPLRSRGGVILYII